jgi:hypothetical protein
MTSPEMLRHIQQLDRLIEQMTFEDEAHIHGTGVGEHQPLQLELFAHRGADREEQA